MRKQDHLLALINSLDANEKRNFRLMAGLQPEETNYLKLFDALENKTHYDAAALSKTLNIPAAQLHRLKHYLVKVLLKSLRYYRDGDLTYAGIANSMLEIRELMDRGLFSFALEVAEKAISKAKEKEAVYHLPQLIIQKSDVLLCLGRLDEIPPLLEEMKHAHRLGIEVHELITLGAAVIKFEQSGKKPEEFKLHEHPLLHIDPRDLGSRRAKVGWFAMMNTYLAATKKDPQGTLNLAKTEVASYDNDASLIDFSPYQYLCSRIRLITSEMQAHNYQNAWTATEKILDLLPVYKKRVSHATHEQLLYYTNYYQAYLSFALGHYQQSTDKCCSIYGLKKPMSDYLGFNILFDYAKALIHTNRTAQAIDKLDELLQINTDQRSDLQPYIRPLMIIAQLDMRNYQLIPYLIKSARAAMKRKKLSDPEVLLFLGFAYAIARAPEFKRGSEWNKFRTAVEQQQMKEMDREIHLGRWLEQRA